MVLHALGAIIIIGLMVRADYYLARRVEAARIITTNQSLIEMIGESEDSRFFLDNSLDSIDAVIVASSLFDTAVSYQNDMVGRNQVITGESDFYKELFTHVISKNNTIEGKYSVSELPQQVVIPSYNNSVLKELLVQNSKRGTGAVRLDFSAFIDSNIIIEGDNYSKEYQLFHPYTSIIIDFDDSSNYLEKYNILSSTKLNLIGYTFIDDDGISKEYSSYLEDINTFSSIEPATALFTSNQDGLEISESESSYQLKANELVDGGLIFTTFLAKGKYIIEFDLEDILIEEEKSTVSDGVYIGVLNQPNTAMSLNGSTHIKYPLYVEEDGTIPIIIGIGGWGSAKADVTISKPVLKKYDLFIQLEEIDLNFDNKQFSIYGGSNNIEKEIDTMKIASDELTDAFWTFPVELEAGKYLMKAKSSGTILDSTDGAGAKVVIIGNKPLLSWAQNDMDTQKDTIFDIDESGTYYFGFGLGGWSMASGEISFNDIELYMIE